MRIMVSILLWLSVLLASLNCETNRQILTASTSDMLPCYEIVIRLTEPGNAIDKVMDVFMRNGLRVADLQQKYLSAEKQEIKVIIRGGNSTRLDEIEKQLKELMNVESVSISKI